MGVRNQTVAEPQVQTNASLAALVKQQEMVVEMKVGIGRLHNMCNTEEGDRMVKGTAPSSGTAQSLIVLFAAWAQLCKGNFGKDCAKAQQPASKCTT